MTTPACSTSATVIVVPMPEVAGSVLERSWTRRFASPISDATRSGPVKRPGSVSSSAAAASFDATSPAWAPPMPSATANSGGATTYASSFRRRLRPVSVLPA